MLINDYRILIRHMRMAMATGMTKERAKIYAHHQLKNEYNINHLQVIS